MSNFSWIVNSSTAANSIFSGFGGFSAFYPNLKHLQSQTKEIKNCGWRDATFKTKFSQIGPCVLIFFLVKPLNSRHLFGTLTSFREQKWAFMIGRSHPMPLKGGLMWFYGIFPASNHNIKYKNILVRSLGKKYGCPSARAQGHPNFEKCWECLGFLFTLAI